VINKVDDGLLVLLAVTCDRQCALRRTAPSDLWCRLFCGRLGLVHTATKSTVILSPIRSILSTRLATELKSILSPVCTRL